MIQGRVAELKCVVTGLNSNLCHLLVPDSPVFVRHRRRRTRGRGGAEGASAQVLDAAFAGDYGKSSEAEKEKRSLSAVARDTDYGGGRRGQEVTREGQCGRREGERFT